MAGYNPQEAIPLWERMERASQGQKPPEFLSTHPSEGTRIDELQKYMPEAMKYYKPMAKYWLLSLSKKIDYNPDSGFLW